jgi:hypothetical protein
MSKSKKTDSKTWIVTTNQERPIGEIAKDLKQNGFTVKDVLEEIGSITGSADSTDIPKLRKIKGVADLSADFEINLGPPGADETW